MIYIDIGAARARAIERSQTDPTDTKAIAYIEELLTLSSANDRDGVLHYRPFWAAATFIGQDPDVQDLISVDQEATFTQAETRVASLFGLQAAYDKANGLIVEADFLAPTTFVNSPVSATASVRTRAILW